MQATSESLTVADLHTTPNQRKQPSNPEMFIPQLQPFTDVAIIHKCGLLLGKERHEDAAMECGGGLFTLTWTEAQTGLPHSFCRSGQDRFCHSEESSRLS